MSYAGNLPIEALREEYRAMLPKLIASATSDRLHWLESLRVKPVMEGSYAITGARLIDGRGGAPVENAKSEWCRMAAFSIRRSYGKVSDTSRKRVI